MRALLVVSAVAAMVVTLVPHRAEACGGPVICPYESNVTDGGTVPANAPGLGIVHRNFGTSSMVQDAMPTGDVVLLVESDGGSLPFITKPTPVGWELTPQVPLSEGETYRLESDAGCSDLQLVFTAAPPATLPTSVGTVAPSAAEIAPVKMYAGAACQAPVSASRVELAIEPSAELRPFLPQTSWQLDVDGVLWANETFGAVLEDGTLGSDWIAEDYGRHRINQLYARCDFSDTEIHESGLAEGAHTGTLTASVAGTAAPLPPVSFTFSLACPADAGTHDEVAADDPGFSQRPESAQGCSATSTAGPGLLSALCVSATLLLARRRRASPN